MRSSDDTRHAFPKRFLPRLGIVLAVTCCIAGWIFVELADDAPEGDYLKLEQAIMLSLRQEADLSTPKGPWWLQRTSSDLTALGGTPVLSLITLLTCGYLLLIKRYLTAVLAFAAVGSGLFLSYLMKSLFARDRPDVVPHLAEIYSSSFPSGHSMMAAVVYLSLGFLVAIETSRRRQKLYFVSVALLLTFIVGLTRIHLGVHYPTDVLAGWAAGTTWALIWLGIAYTLQRITKWDTY